MAGHAHPFHCPLHSCGDFIGFLSLVAFYNVNTRYDSPTAYCMLPWPWFSADLWPSSHLAVKILKWKRKEFIFKVNSKILYVKGKVTLLLFIVLIKTIHTSHCHDCIMIIPADDHNAHPNLVFSTRLSVQFWRLMMTMVIFKDLFWHFYTRKPIEY